MEDPLALVYISYLLDDPNILLIEVWDRVLYVRTKKGRNTFASKKGLKFNESVYYKSTKYKELVRQYHPDTAIKKADQGRKTALTQLINTARKTMEFFYRTFDAVNPIKYSSEFKQYTQTFKSSGGIKLYKSLRKACETGRFRDCFRFLYNSNNKESFLVSWDERGSGENSGGEEDILNVFKKAFSNNYYPTSGGPIPF